MDHRVRVMTWNVWWRFGPEWRERQAGILATIERFAPDVVGLQEVWASGGRSQADEFAAALGFQAGFAGPSYPAAPEGELGVGLLSRWPIVRYDAVVMPARHRAWDPVILSAEIAHPAGVLPVQVACLEHAVTYSDDRQAQAALLAELATHPRTDGPCPSLAIGDLNAAAESAVLRPLRDLLTDAWTAGGGAGDAITLPSTHPQAPLEAGPELVNQRIDHVFFRPGHEDQVVEVEAVAIPDEAVDGVFPSDHRPVICDLRWHDR
ncbi:endonuclease/exonuclease/phosphatase family protein [Kribbella sp. NPDC051770]|uniref:endonuclease/exonuclease/phosphatase family protein n=1 Tax=Kribbella sp. NPDC051770 TaxID=3155413 RepID=UPI003412A68A